MSTSGAAVSALVERLCPVDETGTPVPYPLWAFSAAIHGTSDLRLHNVHVMWRDKDFAKTVSESGMWPGVLMTLSDGSKTSFTLSETLAAVADQRYITCTRRAMAMIDAPDRRRLRQMAYARRWEGDRWVTGSTVDPRALEDAGDLLRASLADAMTAFERDEWRPEPANERNFADLAVLAWVRALVPDVYSDGQRYAVALAHDRLHEPANIGTVIKAQLLEVHTGGYQRLEQLAAQIESVLSPGADQPRTG